MIGINVSRGLESPPATICRFSYRPTTKKKIDIKPSLIHKIKDLLMAKPLKELLLINRVSGDTRRSRRTIAFMIGLRLPEGRKVPRRRKAAHAVDRQLIAEPNPQLRDCKACWPPAQETGLAKRFLPVGAMRRSPLFGSPCRRGAS
jgi:hypothetical protein